MSEELVSIPHESGVTVQTGGPELVTLYDAGGVGIRVHPGDADRLLGAGYTRTTFDRKVAKKDALVHIRALRESLERADGVDDGADVAAINVALDLAASAVAYLTAGLERNVTPTETETVTLVNKQGQRVHVDPAQVALYKTEHDHTEVPHG